MFEFSAYHLLLAGLGTAIIIAHWFPRFFSGREPATSALMILMGVVAGQFIPGLSAGLNPFDNPGLWETATELCVIIGLFGVGLKFDSLTGWNRWRPTVRLLTIAMPLTVALTALLGAHIAGLTLAGALIAGAVLSPTDPVLAGEVQVAPPGEGREHPVRFTLTMEAGLNDALAFPFVYLGIAVAKAGGVDLAMLGEWLAIDVVYRIAAGTAAGVLLGWLIGRILFAWPTGNALSGSSSGIIALAGTLATYGLTELVEGYGFIAAFVAGVMIRRIETHHEFHSALHDFATTTEQTITTVILFALGAVLVSLLAYFSVANLMLVLILVLFVRPIIAWASLWSTGFTRKGRMVTAFYGVRGIGSLYYLSYVGSHARTTDNTQLWLITALVIITSAIVHGLTAGLAVERVEK